MRIIGIIGSCCRCGKSIKTADKYIEEDELKAMILDSNYNRLVCDECKKAEIEEIKLEASKIDEAVVYFEKWIEDDLRELDGDTESDYSKFILDKHKHINTILNFMKQYKKGN